MSAPNPDVFATAALNTLGLENRTAGFWFHKIQVGKRLTINFKNNNLSGENIRLLLCFILYSSIGVNWQHSCFQASWSSSHSSLWKSIVLGCFQG